MKTYGYLRISTNKQDEENQRHEISSRHKVDEFIAVECSSRKSQDMRGLTDLFSRIEYGDTLIVTEISRLGRSISEVVKMVEDLTSRKIGLIAIKNGINIPPNGSKMDMTAKIQVTMFSMMAEIERDLISTRTKEALSAKKAAGVRLGKPPGVLQVSGLDAVKEDIKGMLKDGVSVLAISNKVGFSRTAVRSYIKSRGL